MESLFALLSNPNTPLVIIVLINLVVLLLALPRTKSRFRWSDLFQLIIFDLTAAYIFMSSVPLMEMSNLAWLVAFFLLLWPIVLYRLGAAFVLFFLLSTFLLWTFTQDAKGVGLVST